MPDLHDSLSSTALKLSFMSITNVEWSCLHSGAGILQSTNTKLIREYSDLPSSISYLKCLYKKSKPVFSKLPDTSHTEGTLGWDDKSFSRLITPDCQAFAILSMCSSAEVLYPSDIPLGCSLLRSASFYRDFASSYMRSSDGLFITVEDKTKALDEELKLKPCSKNTRLSDQVLMFEALIYLHSITCREDMAEYLSGQSTQYRNEAESIFGFICESLPQLLSSPSKEISICISSFARCLALEKNQPGTNGLKDLIYTLCAEMEARIRITGEVETGPGSPDTSSMMTHFKVSCAMLEGYQSTGILKFKELGMKIYDYLEDLYNPSFKLYMESDSTKVTCSIRDIADMLKLQLLKFQTDSDLHAQNRLNDMYSVLIENSNIVQSLPDKHYIIRGQSIVLPEHIPDTLTVGKAPVFLKSIKLNLKKDAGFKSSKHFNSLYSLYASYTFLHYFQQHMS